MIKINLTNIVYLKIKITINRKKEIIMVDLDITDYFMIRKYTESRKYSIKIKNNFMN